MTLDSRTERPDVRWVRQRTRPMRRRRTQEERRSESERLLLVAAAEEVLEYGLEGASVAAICRRAGFSHNQAHHRFGSKDALIERLVEEATRFTLSAIAAEVGRVRGIPALRVLADTYLDLVESAEPLARAHLVLSTGVLAHHSLWSAVLHHWDLRFRAVLAAMVRQAQTDGAARCALDPEATAVVLAGMLRGVAVQILLEPGDVADAARSLVLEQLESAVRSAIG